MPRTKKHRTEANALAYDRANHLRAWIYKKQAQALRDLGYGYLVNGSQDARLFSYLLRTIRRENDDGLWVIPFGKDWYSKAIADNHHAPVNKRHRPTNHLRTLMDSIGGSVEVTDPCYADDRSRDILSWILPTVITEILFKQPDLRRGGLLDMVTGLPLRRGQAKRQLEDTKALVDQENAVLLEYSEAYQEKVDFLNYLNNLPVVITSAAIRNAFAWIDEQETEEALGENDVTSARCIVRAFDITRHGGYYGWTANSPRIYGCHGVNLQGVLGDLRRILLPAVVEVDIASCHPTIYAAVFGATVMGQFLATGRPFRPYLTEQIGWEWEKGGVVDQAIKNVVNPLLYGQGTKKFFTPKPLTPEQEANLTAPERQVRAFISQVTDEERARFIQIPEITDLLRAKRRILKQIHRHGYGTDAVGMRWYPHQPAHEGAKPCTALTVLNAMVSSYEWELLRPIREWILSQQDDYRALTIPIYSHDGFSFTCPPGDVEFYVRLFNQIVQRRAIELGIQHVRLEIKYDGITRSCMSPGAHLSTV